MCGIVGVVGKIYKKEEEAFQALLQLDTIRGPHSTGVISVNTKDWEYLKCTGTPWNLFEKDDYAKLMKKYHTALIGHNRWATVGEINDENAHPFHHGDFVGVHNGTLKSVVDLADANKFKTDSEAIYYNMSKEGPDKTISKLDGAFALAWYNNDECAVQIVRNDERPLFMCRSKDGFTYFFASESWMLCIALGKCGVEFNEPEPVEVATLITIPCQNSSYKKEPLLAKIKRVELKPKKQVCSSYYTANENAHTNIVPFRRATNRPFVERKDGVGLKGYLGKVVRFSVHKQMTVNGMTYISCDLEENNNFDAEIRVYVTPNNKLSKRLLESRDYFTAKVKKITEDKKAGTYMLVDNRSITEANEVPFEEENEAGKFEVYNGEKVNLVGWYKCTEKGCAWCSQFPNVQEAKELIWFGRDQFICSDCRKEPEVMQYIMN